MYVRLTPKVLLQQRKPGMCTGYTLTPADLTRHETSVCGTNIGLAIPVADAVHSGLRAIRPFEARSVVSLTDYCTRATHYHDENGHGESGAEKLSI